MKFLLGTIMGLIVGFVLGWFTMTYGENNPDGEV